MEFLGLDVCKVVPSTQLRARVEEPSPRDPSSVAAVAPAAVRLERRGAGTVGDAAPLPFPHRPAGTWGRIAVGDGNYSVMAASGQSASVSCPANCGGEGEALGAGRPRAASSRPRPPRWGSPILGRGGRSSSGLVLLRVAFQSHVSGENRSGRKRSPSPSISRPRLSAGRASFQQRSCNAGRGLAAFWAGFFFSFSAPESQIFVVYKHNREMLESGEGWSAPNPQVCTVNPLSSVISAWNYFIFKSLPSPSRF